MVCSSPRRGAELRDMKCRRRFMARLGPPTWMWKSGRQKLLDQWTQEAQEAQQQQEEQTSQKQEEEATLQRCLWTRQARLVGQAEHRHQQQGHREQWQERLMGPRISHQQKSRQWQRQKGQRRPEETQGQLMGQAVGRHQPEGRRQRRRDERSSRRRARRSAARAA